MTQNTDFKEAGIVPGGWPDSDTTYGTAAATNEENTLSNAEASTAAPDLHAAQSPALGIFSSAAQYLSSINYGMETRQSTSLSQGHVLTKKKEMTILLVGETGVGKTAFLSLVGNILVGHNPSNYQTWHDLSNEEGGDKSGSQTKAARLYKFTSLNGVVIRLLDTPGLADTRGLAYDQEHKASIAAAIQDTITSIDGVLIITNGTTERLQVATDYAITTLSSIFPRSIASNISILFTMIANPLSFNFQLESLPDCLSEVETFNLDNPIALRKRYDEMRVKPKYEKQATAMGKMVDGAHETAIKLLAEFFNWLDHREVQPTTDIVTLYANVCEIDRKIQNSLSRMSSVAKKKRDVKSLLDRKSESEQAMNTYKDFETIMLGMIKVQVDTTYHNTLCAHPQCYSNCHKHCSLEFTLDPRNIAGCAAFARSSHCNHCHHPVAAHQHYNSIWEDKVDRQTKVDHNAKAKFIAASKDKSKYQDALDTVLDAIIVLDGELSNLNDEIGLLCQNYKELSLSGSFSGQISKSIRLLELNLETLQANSTDTTTIIESLEIMRQKEEVVKRAAAAMNQRILVTPLHIPTASPHVKRTEHPSTGRVLGLVRQFLQNILCKHPGIASDSIRAHAVSL